MDLRPMTLMALQVAMGSGLRVGQLSAALHLIPMPSSTTSPISLILGMLRTVVLTQSNLPRPTPPARMKEKMTGSIIIWTKFLIQRKMSRKVIVRFRCELSNCRNYSALRRKFSREGDYNEQPNLSGGCRPNRLNFCNY